MSLLLAVETFVMSREKFERISFLILQGLQNWCISSDFSSHNSQANRARGFEQRCSNFQKKQKVS